MLNIAKFLFAVLIFSIPFNGIKPLVPAGEFSGDGFFLASIPFNIIITLCIITAKKVPLGTLRPMARFMAIVALIFFITSVWNIASILNNSTSLRSGIGKFFVSYGSYLYYSYTFLLIAALAGFMGLERFLRFSAVAFLVSGTFMAIVAAIEVVSWYDPSVQQGLTAFRGLFAEIPRRPIFRLSGVSFEPSFFSFAMLTAIPWVVFHHVRYRSLFALIIAVLLMFFCVVSGARTAYVGLAGLLAMGFLARIRRSGAPFFTAATVPIAMVMGLIIPLVAYTMLDSFQNISNVSRTYLASRAVVVGLEHPFGVGFGQTSFHILKKASSLLRLSWELEAWYLGDRAGELPPVFSWYGRTIAEIGVISYILLAILGYKFMFGFTKKGMKTRLKSLEGELFRMSICYIGIFLAGAFSSDSYKFLPFWFSFLTCSLFLARYRLDVPSKIQSSRSQMSFA